jgi:mRNA-degrading endonuclease YafQ of YafQ-DinJ toxin-antitoxin module
MKKIELNLKKHCIKTEINKQYEKAVSQCIKKKSDEELENIVESLKNIMENNDLIALRGKYKELAGNTDVKAELYLEDIKKYIVLNNSEKITLN